MRYDTDSHRMLSRPVRLHWAGWETDTYRLQNAGWQVSAEQDVMRMQMRLALRAPNGEAYGMSAGINWEYERYARDYTYYPLETAAHVQMGRDVHIHQMGDLNFRGVDAMPQMVERKITRLEDLAHFAAPLVRTQQIVVPEESVSDLMARIIEMQQPDRTARIQQALRNPEGYMLDTLPKQKFHAQILSFAA